MRRQLGWLCLLPPLASLTSAQAAAAGVSFTSATHAATAPPQVPPSDAAAAAPALAAGSDYGPATWVPANPANYSYGNRPHDYPVQMIIIHDTESSYATAIQDFQDPTWAASAHYIVSNLGDITQMVAEKDIAWHAGNWDYNTRSIGIEHEGYAWTCCTFTTAQYDASAKLAASICSRWGVPMDRTHVIGHNEVPDPNNPGLFGGSDHHTDPGPYWNWTYYMSQANSYANALPSPPHMMPDPVAVLNSSTSATVTWQPAQSCHSPITSYTVTGQPGNLVTSLPANATTATFTGLQPGVTYTFTVTANNAVGQDTLTAYWRCTVSSLSAAPASPQPSGSTVPFSGTSAGCPNPLYQFWVLAPGGTWTVAQAYSGSATFNWNTIGLVAGTYYVSLWARDTTSPGTSCSSLGCYDAFVPGTPYSLTSTPCGSVTASAAPASPSLAGTTVAFTGSATGCPHPFYQFWILAPGGSWTIVQAYSTNVTFNWNTTGLAAGSYLYSVWARDSGSAASYDSYLPGTAYTLTSTSCTSATASALPASPQAAGTPVTITAGASGCPNARYEFWILPPGGSWMIVQPYSTSATFNWNTTPPAGTYLYSVWVRDNSSAAAYDVFVPGATYTLTSTTCASVTASAAPATPQAHGTTITITASALGCPNARYEFWILAPGGSWTIAQAYSSTATFNWNTTGLPPGTYLHSVWVRDASSGAGYDAYFPGATYTLT